MSVYYNKKLISGVRDVPQMTLAEYNALTNKPDLWLRTDAPESDRGISASDVEYSMGVSVEDKIDTKANEWTYGGVIKNGQSQTFPLGTHEWSFVVHPSSSNMSIMASLTFPIENQSGNSYVIIVGVNDSVTISRSGTTLSTTDTTRIIDFYYR